MELNRDFVYPQGKEVVKLRLKEIVWNLAKVVERPSDEEIAKAIELANKNSELWNVRADNWKNINLSTAVSID